MNVSKSYTKDEVQFEHPAKGKDHCGQCVHYQARSRSCEIVRGYIEPMDWCDKFAKRQ